MEAVVGVECDEEGFPVDSLRRIGHGWQVQDGESGEWIQQQVFVLRHHPPSYIHNPRPRHLQELVHIHWPVVDQGHIFRGYEHAKSKRLSDNLNSFQETSPRPQHRPPAKQTTPYAFKSRAMFHAPVQIYQEFPECNMDSCKYGTTICITIWKEFLYAPSVLMLERERLSHPQLKGIKPVTFRLKKFFNPIVVNWSLYFFFFGVYFLYCFFFHDLLEIALYLLFASHLSIHNIANCSNIEVKFKGSFFEGPAYALIRMCCQHCAQKGNAEVMWKHMTKMKKDIMSAKVT